MSFSQGLSGLNAAAKALDTVGHNIANSQTYGFKSGSVGFADIFAGAQGMGVQVAGTNQNFGDGGQTNSGRNLDMRITGNGFFRLVDAAGQAYYSRNGQFDEDKDGNLFNSTNNLFLTGYEATGTPRTVLPGAPLGPIKIDKSPMLPQASTSGELRGNLRSGAENLDPDEFDATKPETYSFSTQSEAYDSQGNKHTITVYFIKTADNNWTAKAIDSTAPQMTAPPDPEPVYKDIDLVFGADGKMTSDGKFSLEGSRHNGADALRLEMDLSKMTQVAADESTTDKFQLNGQALGQFIGYVISDKGEIVANYDNGEKQTLAQVALANFASLGGLQQNGGNTWIETPQSGSPVVGAPGSGSLGSLTGYALENSNVDLGGEMVNMIVYQRNYQSNSQTIKTQSELLQTLVNLR
ncbi:flagellar hook protein FlgE [Cedecea sp.]|jgi:flagellar hook protein FlgE|uniref:flagellar hook protein FlgE n=1 Tax=Cedecea sp. TaxID=1970739 RepID=UPI0012AE0F08|nr:flagellar hook-basal body complex protein [Enterobacteriaceae bacterium RIT693]